VSVRDRVNLGLTEVNLTAYAEHERNFPFTFIFFVLLRAEAKVKAVFAQCKVAEAYHKYEEETAATLRTLIAQVTIIYIQIDR